MRLLALLAAIAFAHAADNTLTPEEKRAGWRLLFDGSSMRGWRDPAGETPPGDSWAIEDGCLKTRSKPRISEDLVSADSFGNFEMAFDWRVSPGGNTGVKYRIQKLLFIDNTKIQPGPGAFEGMLARELANPRSDRAKMAAGARGQEYSIGFEFQLLDDERHPDAKRDARHTTGALYSMLAPTARAARPAGEWSQSRLMVNGSHIEHWINGVKVLEGALDSEAAREGIRKRWAAAPAIRDMLLNPKPRGPITLQHHGDAVWFKNVKIRPL